MSRSFSTTPGRIHRTMCLRIAKGEVHVHNATRDVSFASVSSLSRRDAARGRGRSGGIHAIGNVSVRKAADSNAEQRADPRRSEGQAGHRRVVGGARNNAASGRSTPPATPPRAFRNVADSKRNGGPDRKGTEHPLGAGLAGLVHS